MHNFLLKRREPEEDDDDIFLAELEERLEESDVDSDEETGYWINIFVFVLFWYEIEFLKNLNIEQQ